jgi:ParB-like chromosome segregation protein Spo0J
MDAETTTAPTPEAKPFDPKKGINNIAKRGASTFRIDPRELVVEEGLNVRHIDLSDPDQREKLEDLKESWLAVGQVQAIGVRYDGGSAKVVYGHRRRLAAIELVEEGRIEPVVTVVVVDANDEVRRMAVNVAENVHEKINEADQADRFHELLNRGMTFDRLCAAVGMKPEKVRMALDLANSPIAVKDMVRRGDVTAARAIQARKEHGDKAVKVLEKQVEAAHASGIKTVKRERKTSGTPKPSQLPLERSDTDTKVYEAAEEAFRAAVRADIHPGSDTVEVPIAYIVALGAALFGEEDPRVKALASAGLAEAS